MSDTHDSPPISPPPEHADPASAADELASHGLLTFLHRDPPAETERRIRGVMRRIADEAPVHAGGARRLVFPHARRWIALAACFVIAAGLVYLGMPTASSAQATVLASAASLREPGDRRFEIRVQPRGASELLEAPVGTIDTRGRGAALMVARVQPEEGVWITVGRDANGTWVVFPDGRVEHNPPAAAVPRLGMANTQPVAPESIDRVLEELASSYTLKRTSQKGADGISTVEHIVGDRRADRAPGVPRIEVWIDAKTSAVQRIEMTLPPPPEPPFPPRGTGRLGGVPDGGPDGPDGPPRGERGRRPPHDGPPPPPPGGEGRGPGRRDGRGPDDPDGRGPGGPGGPMGRGLRGGPLRIEFRPAPPPQPPLGPEWFTPEHHAKKPSRPRP